MSLPVCEVAHVSCRLRPTLSSRPPRIPLSLFSPAQGALHPCPQLPEKLLLARPHLAGPSAVPLTFPWDVRRVRMHSEGKGSNAMSLVQAELDEDLACSLQPTTAQDGGAG